MNQTTFRTATGARNLIAILFFGFVWPALEASLALAQGTTAITPTTGGGSLGTTVTAHSHTVQITGGTRPDNGTNLFHSFDQFNVGVGNTAQFLNTTPSLPTSNILSRVTGANPSSIFGTIDTMSYPGANLFLMNPAGIVFGPNATLHVGGSVAFTTANYLRLSDTGIFHAEPTATSVLTAAPVVAFGFLGTNPAAIAVQRSSLEVKPGQSISLVGGNKGFTYTDPSTGTSAFVPDGVNVTGGHLSVSGGQINIASVASPGEILTGTLDQAPNINGQSVRTLGTVQISEQSSIDSSKGTGTILIRGGRLTIDNSKISASTGDISLDATSILIKNSAEVVTSTATDANSGHITLMASGDIDMDSSVFVDTFAATGSSGHAGNIVFNSSHGDVNLTGGAEVISFTETNSSGNTGSIKIDAPRGDILLANSSFVFNSNKDGGTGKVETIQINALNLHLHDASAIGGDNEGSHVSGNIAITLDGRLTLAGGSVINTGVFGPADSSDLIISASDILITGKNSDGLNSGLYTSTLSSGDGGRLRLFTDNLQLTDGGILSSKSSIGAKKIIPSGDGGVVSVEGYRNPGTSITIDGPGSGIFATAAGTGNGGAINLSAQSLTMTNGATITASSTNTGPSPGNAGDISINAGQSLEMRDSSITTQSKQAIGGNIDIRAIDRVRLVNSTVSTSVSAGGGSSGNITIDPNLVVLQNSSILAQAFQGQAKNITIFTPLFLKDQSSVIDATSKFGLNGTVTIESPTSNLSGSLGPLASKPSQAQALLTQRCAALASGQASSFVVAGREQLPSDPGGWLSSPLAFAALGESLDADYAVTSAPAIMPMASHDTGTVSLRRLTPTGFLMANFAESEATGCRS
jgi:filamentous hemagglutinin family protein